MPSNKIRFQDSGYFSKLLVDYLNQEEKLAPLYNRFPTLENFKGQLEEKSKNFPLENRAILATELERQYAHTENCKATLENITKLRDSNTFTVTTGHQLNLFTGPLYFLYKIVSTIKLCQQLQKRYPENQFVPVYWMATEDHDFEEINHFQLDQKIIHWNRESGGPVGRMSTENLAPVYRAFEDLIGIGKHADQLKVWFQKAYLQHDTLADATRYLAHQLFGAYGLVILDADCSSLKKLFIPHIQKELVMRDSEKAAQSTFSTLKPYNIQVNPREINLFYLEDHLRSRIVYEENQYRILDTPRTFTESEILLELENQPEKFSPNVLLRPLYQEVILPNLCYIGGGGELAYWLELKPIFDNHQISFPMLLLRNSVVLATQKQDQKRNKLGLTWRDLFLKKQTLLVQQTKALSATNFDFDVQMAFLERQFDTLRELVLKTDPSFSGAVEAQRIKQLKGLKNLEKRFIKAEKKVHRDALKRVELLHQALFPNDSLQERLYNFSEFYKDYGPQLMESLFEKFNPLDDELDIIIL